MALGGLRHSQGSSEARYARGFYRGPSLGLSLCGSSRVWRWRCCSCGLPPSASSACSSSACCGASPVRGTLSSIRPRSSSSQAMASRRSPWPSSPVSSTSASARGASFGGGVCTFDTIADVGFVGALIAVSRLAVLRIRADQVHESSEPKVESENSCSKTIISILEQAFPI